MTGLFHRDKGSEAQIIKLHHRRLRHSPTPNSIRLAHWALQVGDYFYELAAPPKDFVALKLRDDVIRELKSQSEYTYNDPDDEDAVDPSLGTADGFHFLDEDDYKSHTTIVHTLKGKVPLQISKGKDWRRLVNIRSRNMGSTYLKPKKVLERAVHIFESVFKQGYDFLYYNCHAFVCYLFFSISLLDKSTLVDRQPTYAQRTFCASAVIYTAWRGLMTSTFPKSPIPGPTPTELLNIAEKYIEYPRIIPPQKMHDLLNPREVPQVSQQQRIHNITKHVNDQIHHDIMQSIQNQIINASTSQEAATQAALSSQASTGLASWNNPGSNPSAFGMSPGMGFGF